MIRTRLRRSILEGICALASGTMVSRISVFIRNAMLTPAVSATAGGGRRAAFQAANTLLHGSTAGLRHLRRRPGSADRRRYRAPPRR